MTPKRIAHNTWRFKGHLIKRQTLLGSISFIFVIERNGARVGGAGSLKEAARKCV